MPLSLLTVASALSVSISTLMVLVLMYLQHIGICRRATRFWMIAYACVGVRYLFGLIAVFQPAVFQLTAFQPALVQTYISVVGVDFFFIGFASLFWMGTRVFIDLPIFSKRILVFSGAVSVWSIGTQLVFPELIWPDFLTHLYCGGLLFASALSFLRIHQTKPNLGHLILFLLILIRGMLFIGFPVFATEDIFIFWGLAATSLIDLSIGMMLLIAAIVDQQHHTETALHAMQTEMDVRKHAEHVLQERKALFEKVFQLVPVTLTVTRMRDGYYIDVNRNWKSLSGWSRDEVIGVTSADINLWAEIEQRNKLVELINRDGEVRNMQISFRHQDGHIFQCRVSGSKFESENETYLLIASQNIEQELATEQARADAERLLRENEHKYSTIFQLSPIPLGLVDVETKSVIEVNDIWLQQFGFPREKVIGRTAVELAFWDKPEQRALMMQLLLNEGRVDRFEMLHRRYDGRVLTCLLSARLFDMAGNKVFIFSLLDVTRQYQVEQEIRDMTVQLEARVRLRTLKLEQANIELAEAMESLRYAQDELIRSEKMAALGSLVAGVAHELNTPIGNSVTVASTLQDRTKELLDDVSAGKLRRSALDEYLQSATTGTALLMKTLGIARELIRSFKQVAVDQASNQRRIFDLKTSLDEVITTLAPMFNKEVLSLRTEFSPGIVMDSFPGPLGQILTNFMSNALNHGFDGIDKGEMRGEIKRELKDEIQITSRLIDDQHVEIVFADNGIGIPEVDQKRVFDPFFTTKLGQGGSGLGMHIVYNLVTGVLGGSIHLDSKVGEGTSFTILLPLSAPAMSFDVEPEVIDL